MPGGDGTGPQRGGPGTGRGLGFCSGNEDAGYEVSSTGFGNRGERGYIQAWRRGRRKGQGFGYGRFRNDVHPEISHETLLQNEARILKDQLAWIEKQLSELKK